MKLLLIPAILAPIVMLAMGLAIGKSCDRVDAQISAELGVDKKTWRAAAERVRPNVMPPGRLGYVLQEVMVWLHRGHLALTAGLFVIAWWLRRDFGWVTLVVTGVGLLALLIQLGLLRIMAHSRPALAATPATLGERAAAAIAAAGEDRLTRAMACYPFLGTTLVYGITTLVILWANGGLG